MATTFTKIASVTVGSGGAATIDFTSIPSTYTDLQLFVSARFNASLDAGTGAAFCKMTFNASASNYSNRFLTGDGSTVGSNNNTNPPNFPAAGTNQTSNTFGNTSIYIPNYAGSNNKSISLDVVNENNATTAYAVLRASLWSDNSAITSIKLEELATGANFLQYSTATLYGIKNS
jgi:hypothetical protein